MGRAGNVTSKKTKNEAGIAIIISGKLDFKQKLIIRDRGYYIVKGKCTKGILQFWHLHIKQRGPKFTKETLLQL